MVYIAHIRESDRAIQTVKNHLLEVRELAEKYGAKLGVKHMAGLAGMLHDLGKYANAFQTYIREATSNPNGSSRRGEVDHSTAGGKLLYDLFKRVKSSKYQEIVAEIVGNAIISHHSYLHDFLGPGTVSDYFRRVRDKEIEEYEQTKRIFFEEVMDEQSFQEYAEAAANELQACLTPPSPDNGAKLMFLTKYIFSALIDADRTNTRVFENNGTASRERERDELFADYYGKLMRKIEGLQVVSPTGRTSLINELRQEMSEMCERFAARPSGIYTLSIPTGGGKTLASLRYALKHALIYGKKHILYVVPFTTIIEQNAGEVRGIIQDDGNLLEHHSNVVDDAEDNDELEDRTFSARQKLRLAKDNWDSPIVFTTMVQFLNTFYAKGSRYIRGLHNLGEAVIVFDEVQKVPVHCLSLFNRALNFLKDNARSSLILCTATQPELSFVRQRLAIDSDAEMIANLPRVIDAFKRVEIHDRATQGAISTEGLAEFVGERLEQARSILVILNTKAVVKSLYDRLSGGRVPVYHLSTSMCAAHRSGILEQVKLHLKNKETVVCISTQLIEAGVDISFECAVRSLAGLDSIAQAAGRCNRHGERQDGQLGQVYLIDHAEEKLDRLREIKAGKQIARRMLLVLQRDSSAYGGHLLSTQAMEEYFKEFYTEFASTLDYDIKKLGVTMTQLLMTSTKGSPYYREYVDWTKEPLRLGLTHSHRTAAEHFDVIEDLTTSAIVPYGRGEEIIAELTGGGTIDNLSQLLREAQQYTVNLFRYQCDLLTSNNGWVKLLDGKVFALKEKAYNKEFGVDIENDSGSSLHMW
ncbi:CRISPR-associated helicase/endonuclease Cas3 [Cohnella sp. CIP 111063]|uniref:CRISPR-associated helicase/endonuclease Cas3 n=1 Tax=unclassified Cohnella TaxID=2636738 RepID=UPI000B8C3D64|nr:MULTISPECIES: CRISPR-associated helicase/endonuclease Cas3 [unclassified Cohnella]OXS52333.1 CRISPR-associated helicase/endonuclease Cas3 [Cohnella sp. CIP 111063]